MFNFNKKFDCICRAALVFSQLVDQGVYVADDLFSLQIASFFAVCSSVVAIICQLISPVVVYNNSVLVLLEFVYQCGCISL